MLKEVGIAEEVRKAEEHRRAEEARKAEEARIAEETKRREALEILQQMHGEVMTAQSAFDAANVEKATADANCAAVMQRIRAALATRDAARQK